MQTVRDKSHNKNYYIENLIFGKKSEHSCAQKCDGDQINQSELNGEKYLSERVTQNV